MLLHVPPGDGQMMQCSWQAPPCSPYTGILDGACGTPPGGGTGAGGCTTSGGRSGASGAVEVLVLLLAFVALRAVRRRFVWLARQ